MLLNGFPKLRAEPPPANPVRLTLPITSPVPAEVPVLGIVRMFAPVVRSLVRVSTPLAFALVPRLKPEPAFAMVRLLKVVTEVPPMTCAPEPLKFTVFVLAVKVPLLVQLPLTLIVVAVVPASVAPLSICTTLAVVPLAVNVPACMRIVDCTIRPAKPPTPAVLFDVRLKYVVKPEGSVCALVPLYTTVLP